ncbi:MAG: hypothetical protein ACK5RG_17850 [Cyclobacteriaceae bacterium]|jgi:hypothetical protein|nr:hypothetical protein [Flammeovirgaceae bacterium]
MALLDQYLAGETEQVYSEIEKLGSKAFSNEYHEDVVAVVKETMRRVSYNLQIIHNTLQECNYQFYTSTESSWDIPLSPPIANVKNRLKEYEEKIRPFGSLPLSLKLFYEIVGGCNFGWDYTKVDNTEWEGLDPIQLAPLDVLLQEQNSRYWIDEMKEKIDDGDVPSIELAADYLHKDDISGGPAYSIEITKSPTVDSRFLNEEHETTFIGYLRIIMQNGGFGRPYVGKEKYEQFYQKIHSKLLKI